MSISEIKPKLAKSKFPEILKAQKSQTTFSKMTGVT